MNEESKFPLQLRVWTGSGGNRNRETNPVRVSAPSGEFKIHVDVWKHFHEELRLIRLLSDRVSLTETAAQISSHVADNRSEKHEQQRKHNETMLQLRHHHHQLHHHQLHHHPDGILTAAGSAEPFDASCVVQVKRVTESEHFHLQTKIFIQTEQNHKAAGNHQSEEQPAWIQTNHSGNADVEAFQVLQTVRRPAGGFRRSSE